jgi:hypothetical protein
MNQARQCTLTASEFTKSYLSYLLRTGGVRLFFERDRLPGKVVKIKNVVPCTDILQKHLKICRN